MSWARFTGDDPWKKSEKSEKSQKSQKTKKKKKTKKSHTKQILFVVWWYGTSIIPYSGQRVAPRKTDFGGQIRSLKLSWAKITYWLRKKIISKIAIFRSRFFPKTFWASLYRHIQRCIVFNRIIPSRIFWKSQTDIYNIRVGRDAAWIGD